MAIRILFCLLGLTWFGYAGVTLLGSTMGDCFDNQLCAELKNTAVALVFWRWLAGWLILFGAYKLFRKEPDVR